jgi:uncharacterized protein (DUF362 family)
MGHAVADSIQVQPSDAPAFAFPLTVLAAKRVLIKPNVGYAAKPPAIVRIALVRAVVEQLLALDPDKRIDIVEGVCTKIAAAQVFGATGLAAMANDRVRVIDAESLPLATYASTVRKANRFQSFEAPALLDQVDACISIAPFKRTLLNGRVLHSATIKNLYGLLPRAVYHARSPHARGKLHLPNVHAVIADVYHALGARFDFGIVDLHEKFVSADWQPDRGRAVAVGKVVSGSSLLAVDLRACAVADETPCDYLQALQRAQQP